MTPSFKHRLGHKNAIASNASIEAVRYEIGLSLVASKEGVLNAVVVGDRVEQYVYGDGPGAINQHQRTAVLPVRPWPSYIQPTVEKMNNALCINHFKKRHVISN